MYYESSDFLETADSDTLKQIARTRELTREYYFSDYGDIEKRTSILRELLGGIGENVVIDTPFHCDYGKNIFLGNDVCRCIHLHILSCHRKGLCRIGWNVRQHFSEPMHVR